LTISVYWLVKGADRINIDEGSDSRVFLRGYEVALIEEKALRSFLQTTDHATRANLELANDHLRKLDLQLQ